MLSRKLSRLADPIFRPVATDEQRAIRRQVQDYRSAGRVPEPEFAAVLLDAIPAAARRDERKVVA
jgi:hypothetical protein